MKDPLCMACRDGEASHYLDIMYEDGTNRRVFMCHRCYPQFVEWVREKRAEVGKGLDVECIDWMEFN